jgi:hypothetical protein
MPDTLLLDIYSWALKIDILLQLFFSNQKYKYSNISCAKTINFSKFHATNLLT